MIAALLAASISAGCLPAAVVVGAGTAGVGAALLSPDSTGVPDEGPYFWHGTDVGTDATAGPFDVIANKGFATAQWLHTDRAIFDYPYGWSATLRTLTSPHEAAERSGGWRSVLLNEVLPFTQEGWKSWAWVPNYYGHLIEGGIAARRLREWYEARGVPYPSLAAGMTTWGAAFINEAYENPEPSFISAGVTVDLLVFDLGGILLFNSDTVSRYFAQKLRANLWPTQASIMIPQATLWNNSHHLVMKLPVGFTDRASVFVKSGLGFMGGISVHGGNGLDFSVGIGQESSKRDLDPVTSRETAHFGWAGGLWLDRGGSLLASLLVDPNTDRFVALNVFPGVVPGMSDIGFWVTFDGRGRPAFGFSSSKTLGLGLGVGAGS